ncbi:MAG: hypothetical protein ACQCN4_01290 [Candidatus Bathyarchaeia archaeon]
MAFDFASAGLGDCRLVVEQTTSRWRVPVKKRLLLIRDALPLFRGAIIKAL